MRLDKHFRRLYKHAEEYRKAVSQRPAGSSRQRRQLRSCAHQVSRVAPPARPPLQARALTGNVFLCARAPIPQVSALADVSKLMADDFSEALARCVGALSPGLQRAR